VQAERDHDSGPTRPFIKPVDFLRQHPALVAATTKLHTRPRYHHAYDIYMLGIALIEIAVWTDIEVFITAHCGRKTVYNLRNGEDRETLFEMRRDLINAVRRELPGRVGGVYANVVVGCLSVDPPGEFGGFGRTWKIGEGTDDLLESVVLRGKSVQMNAGVQNLKGKGELRGLCGVITKGLDLCRA